MANKESSKQEESNNGEGSTGEVTNSIASVDTNKSENNAQDLSDYNLKAKDSEGKNE